MRNLFIYLFICLVINSCKTQDIVFDVENKDIILFQSGNLDIELLQKNIINQNRKLYDSNNYIVTFNSWKLIGLNYGIYYYNFVNTKKDTMHLKCYCRQENNLFFKNLEFKEGNYELNFNFKRKYNEQTKKYELVRHIISGSQIQTPKEVQNILFKNIYIGGTLQDVYFKDLQFYKIDLKDTIHVKLKKVDTF